MNVLALNSGSSSVKFKLFDSNQEVITYGEIDNFSDQSVKFSIKDKEIFLDTTEWKNRFEHIVKAIGNQDIGAVLHRIVHGAELYPLPLELNENILDKMKQELLDLAPLHNPYAFEIIEDSFKLYPNSKQIAVFDTSFGLTMPEVNYLYGLPYEYYQKYKIRRYAFHGLSHKYIAETYHEYISDDEKLYSELTSQDIDLNHIKIVSVHLGSGCSTCAIKGTQCVDTSFGFTPEENLVMATRVGEIDYSAINYLKHYEKHSDKEISDILNKKSGLLGLSGYSKDMKTLVKDYNSNPRAKLAVDIFVNDVVKQIMNMIASLNGIDALIFTGGMGQHSDVIRQMVCERLSILQVYIDVDKNVNSHISNDILNVTSKKSQVEVIIIPTNEELQMLKDSEKFLN